MMFVDRYATFRLNASAPFFNVGYHAGAAGSFYNKNGPAAGNSYLQIDNNDWGSWDVAMHEFGHHVAAWNNIDASPGGNHNFGGDNIRGTGAPAVRGRDLGTKLAWGEGFATYFGLLAVRSFNLAGTIPGLPSDEYDDWYDDYDAPDDVAGAELSAPELRHQRRAAAADRWAAQAAAATPATSRMRCGEARAMSTR